MNQPECGQRIKTRSNGDWLVYGMTIDYCDPAYFMVSLVPGEKAGQPFPVTVDLDTDAWQSWCVTHEARYAGFGAL